MKDSAQSNTCSLVKQVNGGCHDTIATISERKKETYQSVFFLYSYEDWEGKNIREKSNVSK